MPGTLQPASLGSLRASPELTTDITSADEEQFRDLLVQVQTAWGRRDLDMLRKVATPEMLHYFSNALAENVSQGVENRVEDVMVMHAEVREAWTEDARMYATVSLRWKVRDYTVSLAKRAGEPGYVMEGDERLPTETTEAWTFVRHRNGKWLLSAIQQVE
jgi:predicted lipid-binding transport protein (Tim44 family)